VSENILKGRIIGFEDCNNYVLQDAFGEGSPFRVLMCSDYPVSFVTINPFYITDNYIFDMEDNLLKELDLKGSNMDSIAVLCIVRPNEHVLYVNLRSPLIINIAKGTFVQTILQNESYGVSIPFVAKKLGG
jgi:flagellar assembly factor FliW